MNVDEFVISSNIKLQFVEALLNRVRMSVGFLTERNIKLHVILYNYLINLLTSLYVIINVVVEIEGTFR